MLESLAGIVGLSAETDARAETAGRRDREATDDTATAGKSTAESVVQSVLDGLGYPIFTVDGEGTIDRINDEALDLFEKTRDDLIGVCLFDLEEADNSVMREVLDTGDPVQNLEDTIEVESGEVPVSRSVMPLYDDAGGIVGALEINRDITERVELRQREEILEAYQETVVAELESSLARLSDGDLTVDPSIPEPDEHFEAIDNVYAEYDSMAEDLGDAVRYLRGVLWRTRQQSDELAAIGAEMHSTSDEATEAISDINESSTEVASVAERQADRAIRAEENVADLSASVEEITATVQEIDARSGEAAERAREGTETADDAIETIDAASDASERNIEMIDDLQDRMETIDRMTEMIADIADQTNLLALNANIEAARADGDGAGFQVVANEVKSLAEESKEAVEEISDSLDRLKDGIGETADTIEESNRQVKTGVGAVRTVVEHIETIEAAVRETSEGLEEIRHATNDQAANAEEVSQLVEDVSDASGEVSAGIEEIAAGLDQQTDAAEEVADAASEVTGTSDTLQEMLADFRLGEDEAAEIE
ncbi:methyl-accepting chemotaxis protein [Halorussus amylolyticus]|uniref:methyl-accepting chemotaxis protein n=1 Tax=Halorussus amylolyticus TaxID=1126242 RepID=UPI00138F15AE|nr:methyl-accepting chemotaxis protein [Halorussus amylolyticus]